MEPRSGGTPVIGKKRNQSPVKRRRQKAVLMMKRRYLLPPSPRPPIIAVASGPWGVLSDAKFRASSSRLAVARMLRRGLRLLRRLRE